MNCYELSPTGNFDGWEAKRLEEIKLGGFTDQLGQVKLYEDDKMCLWSISLKANERLPFRRLASDFRVACEIEGFGVHHQDNGKIVYLQFEKGDHFRYDRKKEGEQVWDLLNIGIEVLELIIVESKINASRI